jgi:hypothetical protein
MMKILPFAVALLCAASGLALDKVRAAEAPSPTIRMPAANWLFVQTGATFTSDSKTLTLHSVGPVTLMFSDRPKRMTGDVATARFIQFWNQGKDSFEKDPPNATVSTVIGDKTDLAIVELSNPHIDGDDITYDIKPLRGNLPAAGKQVSVFIDWWHGGWHGGWRGGGWHRGGHGGWRGGWGGPGWRAGWGPVGPWVGGACWRGPYGGLHCRP